jgi:hypothetical protein
MGMKRGLGKEVPEATFSGGKAVSLETSDSTTWKERAKYYEEESAIGDHADSGVLDFAGGDRLCRSS